LIPGGFGAQPQAAPQLIEEVAPINNLTLEDKRRENFAKGINVHYMCPARLQY